MLLMHGSILISGSDILKRTDVFTVSFPFSMPLTAFFATVSGDCNGNGFLKSILLALLKNPVFVATGYIQVS